MIGKLVEGYIQLRDKKAEIKAKHEQELAPIQAMLDKIEVHILQHMQEHGGSPAAPRLARHMSARTSATVADWDSLLSFVQTNGLWQMLERRVAKTAVDEYAAMHKDLPPGVNYTQSIVVNVRKVVTWHRSGRQNLRALDRRSAEPGPTAEYRSTWMCACVRKPARRSRQSLTSGNTTRHVGALSAMRSLGQERWGTLPGERTPVVSAHEEVWRAMHSGVSTPSTPATATTADGASLYALSGRLSTSFSLTWASRPRDSAWTASTATLGMLQTTAAGHQPRSSSATSALTSTSSLPASD